MHLCRLLSDEPIPIAYIDGNPITTKSTQTKSYAR